MLLNSWQPSNHSVIVLLLPSSSQNAAASGWSVGSLVAHDRGTEMNPAPCALGCEWSFVYSANYKILLISKSENVLRRKWTLYLRTVASLQKIFRGRISKRWNAVACLRNSVAVYQTRVCNSTTSGSRCRQNAGRFPRLIVVPFITAKLLTFSCRFSCCERFLRLRRVYYILF